MAGGGGGGWDSGAMAPPFRMISGGSGGFLLNYPLALSSGEQIDIVVGYGGLPGQTGGSTRFGSYLSCGGGHSSSTGGPNGGDCGSTGGFGTKGSYINLMPDQGGNAPEAITPLGYGKGGTSNVCSGCFNSFGYYDKAHGHPGVQGVVYVDAFY